MKSHENDLLQLALCILKDVNAKLTATQLDLRDFMTMKSRVKHEGLSFLTITLPTVGADLEQALSNGCIDSTQFRSFGKCGRIPAFLQGIFSLVFDQSTGRILDEPSTPAIEGIRQIAYTFKKLAIPCSPIRTARAMAKFVEDEYIFDDAIAPDHESLFKSVSRVLWPSVINSHYMVFDDLRPRHGPGATAERVLGNAKYRIKRWHDRIEPYFPLFHNAFSSESAYGTKEFDDVAIVSREDEQPVRVVAVPKTLKTPRIIAIEPVCMQYVQQAISQGLVKALENSSPTKGHVNFTDQSINKELAMKASRDLGLATLDLSSASDRVPRSLALDMFQSNPDLQGAIDACRSMRAEMPNGQVIDLRKFASMGSALCFPVEAMYFYTICIGALLDKWNLPVTHRNVFKAARCVWVYGDDILVPTDAAVVVIDHLQRYYCKVNTTKSFYTGKFRESCGMDAYDGEDVTPTYLRQLPPNDKRDPAQLISWVKTSNLFYNRGYWISASFLKDRVESILGSLPIVGPNCAGLGWVSKQPVVSISRWGHRYQRPEVRCWCATPVYRDDKLGGYAALTKSLLGLTAEPPKGDCQKDKQNLSRTALHGRVKLKCRWTSPF